MNQSASPSPQPKGSFPLAKRFLSLPTMISFAIAGSFILFLFRRFDLDLSGTWTYLRHSNLLLYLLALACYYASFPVRGLRWRVLLENSKAFDAPETTKPTAMSMGGTILLGWFANSILWFRLGDAYRAYLLTDKNKVSFSLAIGTVAAERLLDLVAVAGLLLVATGGLVLTGSGTRETNLVVAAAIILSAVGLLGLLFMKVFGHHLERVLPKAARPIYARFKEGTLGSFQQLPILGTLSVAGWLLETARLYFVLQALGFHVDISLVLLTALAHSMLTTIPLTPGGLGFAELGLTALIALAPGLAHDQALAATLLDRSITYLSVLVIGGLDFGARALMGNRRRQSAGKPAVGMPKQPQT